MSKEGPIKGVLLPQRPPDNAAVGGGQLGGVFRPPGGSVEPWGMCPVQKVSMSEVAAKPPSINVSHKKWVRQLESELAAQKLEDQLQAVQEASKQKSVSEFSAKLRAAILSEQDTSFWKAAHKPAVKTMSPTKSNGTAAFDNKDSSSSTAAQPSTSALVNTTTNKANKEDSSKQHNASYSPSPKPHSALDNLEDFVNDVYNEAAAKSAGTSGRGDGVRGEAGTSAGCAGHERAAAAADKGEGGKGEASQKEAAATPEKPSTSGKDRGAAEGDGLKSEAKGGSMTPPTNQERPGSAQSSSLAKSGKPKSKLGNKPAWALSQQELEKKEMSEEDELLAFTEQLDFDAFMDQLDDVELKDAFQELQDIDKKGGDDKAWRKSFVRACNHAAMRRVQKEKRPANSDDDGCEHDGARSVGSRSIASTRLRAKNALLEALEKKQEQWDFSTRAGDDVAQMGQASKAAAAAEEFLIENPDMKAVHSAASVRAMMDRAEQPQQH